jgi:hypothetical protein
MFLKLTYNTNRYCPYYDDLIIVGHHGLWKDKNNLEIFNKSIITFSLNYII